ncbi:MAG: hypothetical protein IT311_04220 [Anaerolineales bacterium]|nr:hypothetical protein [Anaerolineales bacterium]MCZ2122105.1 Gmad2 immunoglobulin-like domain-containing protein [Anaerolineales bacterium]
MVRNHPVIFLLILTLTTLACGLPSTALPTLTPVPAQPATPTLAPQLTLDQIKNAQYKLNARDDHAIVQLTDGVYQNGTDNTTADFARVFLTENIAFGDLDGDGVNEAAAVFFENFGGTGSFGYVVVYSLSNNQPIFVTATLIDDRPMINQISIENGEIFLDAVTHGAEDPACCPTLETTRRYALVNNQLRMVHYTTNTPDGRKRETQITAPVNGTEASGAIQVSGNVSIAPFENNLSYFIYGADGAQYAEGPVMVHAPDFGAPGTFDETISLKDIPSGTLVYIEIQDISAADGSLLTLDAVKITVK